MNLTAFTERKYKMIKHYMIRYKQKFMGEILEDSYDKYCTYEELQQSVMRLYEDHHVFSVDWHELP